MSRLTSAISEEWKQLAHPADVQQSNVRNVLIDGIGVGLVTGVSTFLAVFLARMGASPLIVGLLTAMPALTGMILALPVGRIWNASRMWCPGIPGRVRSILSVMRSPAWYRL